VSGIYFLTYKCCKLDLTITYIYIVQFYLFLAGGVDKLYVQLQSKRYNRSLVY